MVTEHKSTALIKAAGINVASFGPGLFAKTLANVNIESPICNVGAGRPAQAAGPVSGAAPTTCTTAAPAGEKEVEAKKTDDV